MDFQLKVILAEYGIWLGYILLGAAFLAIILFTIYHLVIHPRRSVSSLVGLGALVVVFLISYLSASAYTAKDSIEFSEGVIKMADAGIIMLYILGIIAVLGWIVGEIWSIFK